MFLHSLKNSPAQLARRHVWSLPLHRKSPVPRSAPLPPPPAHPSSNASPTRSRSSSGRSCSASQVRLPPSPRFHPAHATQALPWSSPCLRSAAPLATRLQSPSPPPFPVSTPFCFRAPCRAGNPIILYRLTVRPKQCPTDLDDQSRGTRTNKKAWITCMVVYS